jgi:hypothetical protein
MNTFTRALWIASATAALVAITGCGNSSSATTSGSGTTTSTIVPEVNNCGGTSLASPAQPTPTANYAGTALTGTVKAGTLPMIGASVQLYAAGSSGNGSAPTPLLGSALTTNATGSFSVPSYTCPESNSVLYAVASGGSTTAGSSNAAAKLAAVIGQCNALTGSPAITIDEATTVATAYAMNQFLATGGKMGATSTNAGGIGMAAATAANLANLTTGTAPGANFPSTGTAPTAKLNTLANLLNACIVSGSASADCTQLFADTASSGATPTNTLDAMTNLAKQPGTNVGPLYALSSGFAAYAPTLTAQPSDWVLYATYSGGGMNDPSALSIDSTGNIWVANYFNVTSVFSNSGAPLAATGLTDASLYNSYGGAVNVKDQFWVTNEQGGSTGLGSVTVFNTGGSQGSFSNGALNYPLAAAFDPSGAGWVVDYGDATVSLFSASQAVLSGSSGYHSSQLVFPVAVATDADCNAYVANRRCGWLKLLQLRNGQEHHGRRSLGCGNRCERERLVGELLRQQRRSDYRRHNGRVWRVRLLGRRHRSPAGHCSRRRWNDLGGELSRSGFQRVRRRQCHHPGRPAFTIDGLGTGFTTAGGLCSGHRCKRKRMGLELRQQHHHRVRRYRRTGEDAAAGSGSPALNDAA